MLSEIEFRVVRDDEEAPAPNRSRASRDAGEELLSHVSHEMRTPLNVVYQFVSIVLDELDGPLSDDQRSHLQTALDNVNQLRAVIGDLLDLRRIESGSFAMDPADTDLDALVRSVVAAMSPMAAAEGLRLFVRVERALPAAWIDAARFRQVLTNLLDNAIKFTAPGGEIRVAVARSQTWADQIEVAVEDTGVGIPAAEIDRVFDHLTQASNQVCSRPGLGLGLHVCRQLVACLGGRISVESEEGCGSRFAFTVPVGGDVAGESLHEFRDWGGADVGASL